MDLLEEKNFIVTTEKGRIDKVLRSFMPDYSRTMLQEWIKNNHVLVNEESIKSNYMVQTNDHIKVSIPDLVESEAQPQDIKLEIIYEDDDVAVINKPQGMVVHPAAGHKDGTLVNALLFHIKDLSGIGGVIRPGIVHRIDKDTSGLLMVAKNDFAHEKISEQLKNRSALREYTALVHGVIPHDEGTIDAPIGRSPKDRKKYDVVSNGKPSITHFKVLERFANYTLVSLRLETGRTHQIRVHMAYIGFPLVGDPLYGPRKTIKGNGQFLHANGVGFVHPTTEESKEFHVPLPKIFENLLEELRHESK